jgi:hypothetical protein
MVLEATRGLPGWSHGFLGEEHRSMSPIWVTIEIRPASRHRTVITGLVVTAEPIELLSGVAISRSIPSIRDSPGARSRVMSGLTGGHATNRDWRPLIRLPQNASALADS